MAESKQAAAPVAAVAHDELKATALVIYADIVRRGSMVNYEMGAAALKSFQLARAFLDTADKIEAGELSSAPPAPLAAKFVEVALMELVGGDGGKEVWTPTIDQHGRPVIEKQPVDYFSFAPNLSTDHPINVRSGLKLKSEGGKTVVAN